MISPDELLICKSTLNINISDFLHNKLIVVCFPAGAWHWPFNFLSTLLFALH